MSASLLALLLACDPIVPSVGRTHPDNGATGVPANAAIVFESTVRDGSVTAMVVVTSGMGGASGPAVVGAGDVFVFDPGFDLAPGNWTAMISLSSAVGGFSKGIAFVVSGTGTDAVAPVLTGEVAFDIGGYVDVGPIDDCPDPPGVYAVASDWDDATDASPVAYAVRGLLLAQSGVTIAAPASETLSLEVFAYDEAGNAGALPAAQLDVPGPPGDEGGGCSCRLGTPAPRGAGAGVALLALAAFALRRRARETV